MDITTSLVLLVLLALVAYVIFGKDKLASAIRARLIGAKREAANAIDQANARVAAAQEANDTQLRKARSGQYEVEQAIAAVQIEIARVQKEIDENNAAMKGAAKANDREAFDAAHANLLNDQADQKRLQIELSALQERGKEVEDAVSLLQKREKKLQTAEREIASRARVAQVGVGVNELLAGLDLEGRSSDLSKAYKIVEQTEAKAMAAKKLAEGATSEERMERKLKAYAASTETQPTTDELWSQMTSEK